MNVVSRAIKTIMENSAGEITLMSRPMLRMTSSIRPCGEANPVPGHKLHTLTDSYPSTTRAAGTGSRRLAGVQVGPSIAPRCLDSYFSNRDTIGAAALPYGLQKLSITALPRTPGWENDCTL